MVRDHAVTYPLAGTAFLATFLALAIALILNLIFRPEWAKLFLVRRHDNGFLRLFHKALTETKTVSVTLSNRKVYIGYVIRTPNLSPEDQFVGLLPMLSGYRDKDTLRLNIVTNYGPAMKSGTTPAEDFEVTFALSSIDSASLLIWLHTHYLTALQAIRASPWHCHHLLRDWVSHPPVIGELVVEVGLYRPHSRSHVHWNRAALYASPLALDHGVLAEVRPVARPVVVEAVARSPPTMSGL